MSYSFIEDLPNNLHRSTSELDSLVAAWRERRAELEGMVELTELHDRLRHRWAVETGMIEGLYTIDRGTTELLIDHGLNADLISRGDSDRPAAEIVPLLWDQAQVYDWLFEFIKDERELSTSYIKELHQLLTRNQHYTMAVDAQGRTFEAHLLKGEWKRLPNNPRRPDGGTHEYCPPEHVDAEMDRLVAWHLEHRRDEVAPEIEAAWLHHRFTQIHPFQDGNGRVARALATLVLIRANRFALSISPEQKGGYIDALERADAGDLEPFADLIARTQQREFAQALSVAQDLVDEQQILAAAMRKAASQRDERVSAYADVKMLGDDAVARAFRTFSERRDAFHERLRSEQLDGSYVAFASLPGPRQEHYYFAQILECAHKLDYFADTREYRNWVRLTIRDEHEQRAVVLVISLHSLGRVFKGVLSAIAFVEVVDGSGEGEQRQGPWLATEDAFTLGYLDSREHVLRRFDAWLQTAWLSLLRTWQDTL